MFRWWTIGSRKGKGRDLTQSMTKPRTRKQAEMSKGLGDNNATERSITQRLWTDL